MIEALFLQAMVDAALEPTKPIVADGSLHRDRAVGDKAGSKNLWYVLHAGEDSYGAFGSWKTGQSHTWEKRRPGTITPAQQAAFMELRAAAQKARESEQVAVHAEAASRAMKFWNDARPANDSHPYRLARPSEKEQSGPVACRHKSRKRHDPRPPADHAPRAGVYPFQP